MQNTQNVCTPATQCTQKRSMIIYEFSCPCVGRSLKSWTKYLEQGLFAKEDIFCSKKYYNGIEGEVPR